MVRHSITPGFLRLNRSIFKNIIRLLEWYILLKKKYIFSILQDNNNTNNKRVKRFMIYIKCKTEEYFLFLYF